MERQQFLGVQYGVSYGKEMWINDYFLSATKTGIDSRAEYVSMLQEIISIC